MPRLVKLHEFNLKLTTKKRLRVVRRVAQNITNAHKHRLIIYNNTRIWRDRDLTIGKGIQSIYSLIRRLIGSHLNDNLHLLGSVVIDLLNLYLTLIVRLDDRLLDRLRSCGVRYLGNGQGALINLRDTRTDTNRATTQTIVIVAGVHNTSRLEVWHKAKLLATEIRYRGVDKLDKIVRQDLRCKTHGDTISTLSE